MKRMKSVEDNKEYEEEGDGEEVDAEGEEEVGEDGEYFRHRC